MIRGRGVGGALEAGERLEKQAEALRGERVAKQAEALIGDRVAKQAEALEWQSRPKR